MQKNEKMENPFFHSFAIYQTEKSNYTCVES